MGDIVVLSQDRKIFAAFEEAGVRFIRVTSAAAALVLLKDQIRETELIFIDEAVKWLEEVRKLIIKKELRHFIIGTEIPKPLKPGHIQQVLLRAAGPEPRVQKSAALESDEERKEAMDKRQNPKTADKIEFSIKEKTNIYSMLKGLRMEAKSTQAKELVPESKIIAGGSLFIQQQVIAVTRVKGGVGATLLACHLARYLEKMKVCLVDLDFRDGGSDLSYYLDLPKVPNWGYFLRNKNKESFGEALNNVSGISVLQAPPGLQLIEGIGVEDIGRVVNWAKKIFNIIIFDLPVEPNHLSQETLEYATATVIVTEGHTSELARIEKNYSTVENPLLVLNKKGSGNLKNFREYLGIKDIICIPEDNSLFASAEKHSFAQSGPFWEGVARIGEHILSQSRCLAQ